MSRRLVAIMPQKTRSSFFGRLEDEVHGGRVIFSHPFVSTIFMLHGCANAKEESPSIRAAQNAVKEQTNLLPSLIRNQTANHRDEDNSNVCDFT